MSLNKKDVIVRAVALGLAGAGVVSATTGCGQKVNTSKEGTTDVSTIGASKNDLDKNTIVKSIETLKNDLVLMFPELTDEIINNSALMLSLDLLTIKDEKGHINSDIISEFKIKIDSDKMLGDFNSFLDYLQEEIIIRDTAVSISEVLPDEKETDRKILASLESIVSNTIYYSQNNDEAKLKEEFDLMYHFFVEKQSLEMDGFELNVFDLSYSARAVANMYAEAISYLARNYISEKNYAAMDKALDDQDNKGQMKEALAILANQMDEESELKDLSQKFDELYSNVSATLNGKINATDEQIKDLVNYLNMNYLNSDKVSTSDKDLIFNGYTDDRLTSAIDLVQAISEYNYRNQKDIIRFSDLLFDDYKKTEIGKVDSVALDFTQYNSIQTYNTKDTITNMTYFGNNPYSANLFKYFTKQNFEHTTYDENGNLVSIPITFAEISYGANFVNNTEILYTLNSLTFENIENYTEKVTMNIGESVKEINVVITGECKPFDAKELIK